MFDGILVFLGKLLKGYGTYIGLIVTAVGLIFGQSTADALQQFGTGLGDFLSAVADFLPYLGGFLAFFGVGRKAGDKASKAKKI